MNRERRGEGDRRGESPVSLCPSKAKQHTQNHCHSVHKRHPDLWRTWAGPPSAVRASSAIMSCCFRAPLQEGVVCWHPGQDRAHLERKLHRKKASDGFDSSKRLFFIQKRAFCMQAAEE